MTRRQRAAGTSGKPAAKAKLRLASIHMIRISRIGAIAYRLAGHFTVYVSTSDVLPLTLAVPLYAALVGKGQRTFPRPAM
jgi:hypothetical protein